MASLLTRALFLGPASNISRHIGQRYASSGVGFPPILGLSAPFIRRPPPGMAFNLVVNGTTVPPDPPGLDMKEFLSGAHLAINRTTEVLSAENIEDHSDLFVEEIFSSLRTRMSELDPASRKKLFVGADDIFFSWINGIEVLSNGRMQIKCIAMSFPCYDLMKKNMEEKREIEEGLREEIKELMSKRPDAQVITSKMNNSQIKDLDHIRAELFRNGEIVVSNVDFYRSSESSPWVIKNFSMMESRLVHTPPGHWMWRLRLKVSIESQKVFLFFLRIDYFTNFLFVIAIIVSSLITPTS